MKLEINEKGCARINLYLNTIKNEDEKLIYEKLKNEKYPSNKIKEILKFVIQILMMLTK